MRFRHLLILIALIAATPPPHALGSPADLDAAQKLTLNACEAMARKDFKPILELIRNGDIRSQVVKRMPEGYPADPAKREQIAAGFMQTIEAAVPAIWAYAPVAERSLPPPREENGILIVPIRFDYRNRQKWLVTVFQFFRYRTSPDGPRLVNIETPLAGSDLVSVTVSLMPPHWPERAEDKEKKRRTEAVIHSILRGAHYEEMQAAQKALKDSPDDVPLRISLAGALASMGNCDDAAEIYNDLLKRGQVVLFAHDQLAGIALAKQHYDEAVAHLQTVLDGLGEDDWMLARIAGAQMLAGKNAEAKATIERALKLSPFSRHALDQRARLRVREGALDGAAADLRHIKEHHSLSVEALLKDPDFSKLVLMEKYSDLLEHPSETKAP